MNQPKMENIMVLGGAKEFSIQQVGGQFTNQRIAMKRKRITKTKVNNSDVMTDKEFDNWLNKVLSKNGRA